MMRISFIVFAILQLCCLSSSGQRYYQKMLCDTLNYNLLHGMSGTSDGGVILTGIKTAPAETSGYVIKLGKSGLTEWAKRVDGVGIQSWFYRAHQTSDNGYIMVGWTDQSNVTNNILLMKTDPSGNPVWLRRIGGMGGERPGSVRQTADGGYIIAGNTSSFGSVSDDGYVVKTDKNGILEWTRVIGGTQFESFTDAVQAKDGGYLITGIVQKPTMRNPDIIAIKLDNSGNVSWMNKYEYAGGDGLAYKVIQTNDGGYAITGNIGNLGMYLLRIGAMGNVLWTKAYSVSPFSASLSLIEAKNGDFLLAGSAASYNYSILVRTNALGDTLWTKAYGDVDPVTIHNGTGIAEAPDGALILAGNIRNLTTNTNRNYVLKTDEAGKIPCGQLTMPVTVTSINVDVSPLQNFRVTSGGQSTTAINLVWMDWMPQNDLVCVSKDKAKVKLGKDTALCSGDALMLKGEIEPGSKILWSTGSTTDSIKVTQTGTYWCRAILNSDTAWDTITVTFKPRFKVYLGPDTAFCSRFSHVLDPGNKNHKYEWSTGDTTFTLRVTTAGVYSVAIRDSSTCAFGDTIAIEQVPQPTILIEHDPACQFAVLSFSDTVQDFIWSTGETTNPIKVYTSGIYELTFRNPFCSNKDTITVERCESFYHIPNAFTPGKDHLNDVFTVYGEGIIDINLRIHDRWGELLYTGTAWDGTFKGNTCPEGVYVYMVSFKGTFKGKPRKMNLTGTVTLLR